MASTLSSPNIAFVKYWGNRNDTLRLPAADSLSMTLDSPTVEVTIELADTFSIHSYNSDGSPRILTPKEIARFQTYLTLAQTYFTSLNIEFSILNSQFSILSHVPPGIGLASSAAIFSALACAYAELIREKNGIVLSNEQIGILARLGSGSAARSMYGGFVALGSENGIAVQIAPETHWPLHDIIVVPSLDEKKTGSTEGHALAHTSPLFKNRLQAIPRRMQECTDAILRKDFEKLQSMAEEDCLDMHRVMQTSSPPLRYLAPETHRVIKELKDLRNREHLAVLYTMDAGPTVHLVCTDDAVDAVKQFAHAQKDCTIFETKVGKGAKCRETVPC